MLRALIFGIMSIGLLSGCFVNDTSNDMPSFYYSKTTPSGNQIVEKLKNCAVESFQKVPARTIVDTSPTYNMPINCSTIGTQTRCSGGSYGGRVSSYDENDTLRDYARMQCLEKVDVYRSYGIGQSKSCPKSYNDGGFAGWFDGRLRAVELASMESNQFINYFYNSVPVQDNIGRVCIVIPSMSSTDAGTVNRLIDFPENFVKLSLDERSLVVAEAMYKYPKFTKNTRSILMAMTFKNLAKKMQATIDFCTKKTSDVEYAQELRIIYSSVPGFETAITDMNFGSDISFKKVCTDGKLP